MAISQRHNRQHLEDDFDAEEQAFHQQKEQLLQKYRGQFVALYQGRVVDHAADDEELVERMYNKFGDASFYIAKVDIEPVVYEILSPENH